MSITIRPATEADVAGMLEIYNAAILFTTASYHYNTLTLDDWHTWFAGKQAGPWPVFVAVDAADAVVGWSTYGPFRGAWIGYRYTVEHSVYVAEGLRGQGIGKQLLQPLIDHARSQGMHALIAGISADNTISIRLHRAFGFVQVAHFREVGYKFDRWLDLLFFELLLEAEA